MSKRIFSWVLCGGFVFLFQSCTEIDLIDPIGFETTIEADEILFAVIGDFGKDGEPEKKVADMVKGWKPDFILTTGDNNYPSGEFRTIKQNIGKYYSDYIYNFDAPFVYQCHGKAFQEGVNRFFPCPGNHDANNKNDLTPYLNYFTLPGHENYYKFIWGPVTFYSLDSKTGNFELQKAWLFQELDNSSTPFNIVCFHHPPWTMGGHSNNEGMQWDFYHHGVDVVLTGHDHVYCRIEKKDEPGMYYIVNGLGGKSLYQCNADALPSDKFTTYCFDGNYGAIKAKANNSYLEIKFYSISNPDYPVDFIAINK